MDEIKLARDILAYANKNGAEQCEIYRVISSSELLRLREGNLSEDKGSEQGGYSVRLIRNGVPGFSYGVSFEKNSLCRSVDQALLSCDYLETDPHYFFTQPGGKYQECKESGPCEISYERRMNLLKEIDCAVRSKSGINRAESVSAGIIRGHSFLINSLGLELERGFFCCSAGATAVAVKDNDEQLGGEWKLAETFEKLNAEEIGKKAADEALIRISAGSIETDDYPVIFRSDAAVDLLCLILPSLMGDRAEKGMSHLKGRIGEIIASDCVTLIDNAASPEFVCRNTFDDEGQPCRKNVLIEKGKLRGFLYNNRWGSAAGTVSSGNGFCGSYKGVPSVSSCAFSMEKGDSSPGEMMRKIHKGVLVRDLMGLHMADPVSGDFSLGITGSLIENGEMTSGVRGVMLAGNLFELLKDIEEIGSDYEVYSEAAAPSFFVKSLKISGK